MYHSFLPITVMFIHLSFCHSPPLQSPLFIISCSPPLHNSIIYLTSRGHFYSVYPIDQLHTTNPSSFHPNPLIDSTNQQEVSFISLISAIFRLTSYTFHTCCLSGKAHYGYGISFRRYLAVAVCLDRQ